MALGTHNDQNVWDAEWFKWYCFVKIFFLVETVIYFQFGMNLLSMVWVWPRENGFPLHYMLGHARTMCKSHAQSDKQVKKRRRNESSTSRQHLLKSSSTKSHDLYEWVVLIAKGLESLFSVRFLSLHWCVNSAITMFLFNINIML